MQYRVRSGFIVTIFGTSQGFFWGGGEGGREEGGICLPWKPEVKVNVQVCKTSQEASDAIL